MASLDWLSVAIGFGTGAVTAGGAQWVASRLRRREEVLKLRREFAGRLFVAINAFDRALNDGPEPTPEEEVEAVEVPIELELLDGRSARALKRWVRAKREVLSKRRWMPDAVGDYIGFLELPRVMRMRGVVRLWARGSIRANDLRLWIGTARTFVQYREGGRRREEWRRTQEQ